MATTHAGTSGTQRSTHGMQAGMGRTPDTTYDLISVMYHTLQGCETYEQYAQDAEQAGQKDAAQFFRDAGREFERLAERGRQLLAQCLQQGQGGRSQLSSQNAGSQSQQQAGGSLQQQQSGSSSQSQQSGSMSRAQPSGSQGGSSSSASGSSRGSSGSSR
ncbi:MAG: hypothetical protein ACM3NZ_13545 [Betaproteobacteria bacterium]